MAPTAPTSSTDSPLTPLRAAQDARPTRQRTLATLIGGVVTGPSTIEAPHGTLRCYPTGVVWLLRDGDRVRLGSWREAGKCAAAYRAAVAS